MSHGILFAIAAATFVGLLTLFHQLASAHIDKVLGAILISLTAVIFGIPFLLYGMRSATVVLEPRGLLFVILAGICAFSIDFFVLKAYATGLPVSIGGPIVIGGSIAIAVTAGFFLGDSFSAMKILGITLIVVGAVLLSRYSV